MASGWCKYKNLFGVPKEGIHKLRILDFAVVDIITTIIISWVVSYLLRNSFLLILVMFMMVGVIAHKLFCVDTTLNKIIFG